MPTRPACRRRRGFPRAAAGIRELRRPRRFCGPVLTVKCFEDNSPVKAALESPARAACSSSTAAARCAARADRRQHRRGGGQERLGQRGDRRRGARQAELAACRRRHPRARAHALPTDGKTPGQTGVPGADPGRLGADGRLALCRRGRHRGDGGQGLNRYRRQSGQRHRQLASRRRAGRPACPAT